MDKQQGKIKTIKGEVNRFNLLDVGKSFHNAMQQIINITDFLDMDFEDNYIAESNRVKDAYRKMAKAKEGKSSARRDTELVA